HRRGADDHLPELRRRLVGRVGVGGRQVARRRRVHPQRRPRRRLGRAGGRERVPVVLRPAPALHVHRRSGQLAMTHYVRHLDYLMLATALSISAFGLWIMQSATKNYAGNLYGHQLLYVAAGTVGMLAVAAIPPALMRRVRWPLYAFVLLSTAAVLAVGTSIGGRRWINLGAFQFQPSEFAKLLLIVGLAAVLASRRGVTGPARLTLLAIGYVALPALLVFKEPDLGTTLVFLAI